MENWIKNTIEILKGVELEWWQLIIILFMPIAYTITKAFVAVLIGRCVKPEIAKIALPLVLKSNQKSNKSL